MMNSFFNNRNRRMGAKRTSLILAVILILSCISINSVGFAESHEYIGEGKGRTIGTITYYQPIKDERYFGMSFIGTDYHYKIYSATDDFYYVTLQDGSCPCYVLKSDIVLTHRTIAYLDGNFKVIKSCYLETDPYKDAVNARRVRKGDTLHIVELVVNRYNNLWAKMSDDTYIYAGYKAKPGISYVTWITDLEKSGDQYVELGLDIE